MARITIEDCEKVETNRFKIIEIAAQRARRLRAGFDVPRVPQDSDKATVIALRELSLGLLHQEDQSDQSTHADQPEQPDKPNGADNTVDKEDNTAETDD